MKNLKSNEHTKKNNGKIFKLTDKSSWYMCKAQVCNIMCKEHSKCLHAFMVQHKGRPLTDFTTFLNLFWSCIPRQVRGRGHLHHPCRPGWGHHLTVYPLGYPFLLWFGRDLRGLLSGGIPLLFLWVLWQWQERCDTAISIEQLLGERGFPPDLVIQERKISFQFQYPISYKLS